MKKLFWFLVVIFGVIALLPLVGNKTISNELVKQVKEVNGYGVKVLDAKTNSTYFTTSQHYTLKVVDKDKFVDFLAKKTNANITKGVTSVLDDVEIGLDVSYSNFPISSSLGIDIYPMTFSKKFINKEEMRDPKYAKFLKTVLKEKDLLYHLDINALTKSFDGYIKDIDKTYTSKNNEIVSIKLKGLKFNGSGLPYDPTYIKTVLKEIQITTSKDKKNMRFELNNINSFSKMENDKYEHKTKIKTFELSFTKNSKDQRLSVKGLKFGISSDMKGKTSDLAGDFSIHNIDVITNKSRVNVDKFNYNITLSKIDTKGIKVFLKLVEQAKQQNSRALKAHLQQSLVELISKGFELNLKDFSVQNIAYNKKSLNGFDINSKTVLKLDDGSKSLSPKDMLSKLSIDSHIHISKQIYPFIEKQQPLLMMMKSFSKEQGNNVIFDIKLKDSKLTINGKRLGR